MTFGEYDKECEVTAKYPNIGNNILYPLSGLLEETGEVSGVIKKAQRTMNEGYDGQKVFFTAENGVSSISCDEAGVAVRKKVLDECGDVLWYLNRVVREAGSTLEEVARMNIEKVKGRLKNGTLLATEKRPECCDGSGWVEDWGENKSFPCGTCNPKGLKECLYCHGNALPYVDCAMCGGTGKR